MGMGFALANKMSQSFTPASNNATQSTPPPIPQQTQYFVALNGQQSGPFNLADLSNQIKSGTVTRQTLIWSQALVEWTKAGEVAELANSFSIMPPPLPTK